MSTRKKHQSKNRKERLQTCYDMVKRLEEFANLKGETMGELQRSLDLSGSYFSKTKRGEGTFGADILVMIFEHYRDLSPDWLMFGSGSKLRGGSTAETRVIDIANKKSKLEKEVESLVKRTKQVKKGLQEMLKSAEIAEDSLDKLLA